MVIIFLLKTLLWNTSQVESNKSNYVPNIFEQILTKSEDAASTCLVDRSPLLPQR